MNEKEMNEMIENIKMALRCDPSEELLEEFKKHLHRFKTKLKRTIKLLDDIQYDEVFAVLLDTSNEIDLLYLLWEYTIKMGYMENIVGFKR